ncbi:Maf family protein [Psychrobacter sanguinis]|jgi:septum formation protein|uniref:Maf family protein n=1 Tax=Psychrobacter sanguinis TaxID=861445 RepID=UPI0028ADD43B|nr:Maf family protein [Psychrobacter sanguinis]
MKIILASSSPRRQDLLSLADIEFTTQAVDVDESVLFEEMPQDYIVRMVQAKAEAAAEVIKQCVSSNNNSTATNLEQKQKEHYLVITADTIGVLADGVSILVKPTDKTDAFAMWQKMSNTQHAVWTAVQLSVIDSVGKVIHTDNILEKTEVTFIELDNPAMEAYWATGEPTDKAGGYAIQGKGASWVERINGSYSNVVGLPLAQTIAAIKHIKQQFCE